MLAALLALSCNRPTEPRDPAAHGDVQSADARVAELVPMGPTSVEQLSTDTLEHTELFRLSRDFGKQEFEIALDAWVDRTRPSELAAVRLWWARPDREDERSPFGARTRRHFEISDERFAPDHWRINLVSDRKVFAFDIRIEDDGRPVAHAAVRGLDGRHVERCRVERGELKARRVVGVPAGIDELLVSCTDADGTRLQGTIVWSPT